MSNAISKASGKRLIAVHGSGHQPDGALSNATWRHALRAGLNRDHPKTVDAFDAATFIMPRYADVFSQACGHDESIADIDLDKKDRDAALKTLCAMKTSKAFRRTHYERLPGKSASREFLADIAAPLFQLLGLGRKAVSAAVPEFEVYWRDADARDQAQQRLADELRDALHSGDSVMLIAHGFGATLAYDVLWQLGKESPDRKLDLLVTVGSPLADNTVRAALAGADESDTNRYPANLFRWHNLAAEDDFLCHDKTVANDFGPMLRGRQISELVDHPIYNLAVRFGRSAPGFSAGYLVHPRMAELLANWLVSDSD